jgi:hypothetical protein
MRVTHAKSGLDRRLVRLDCVLGHVVRVLPAPPRSRRLTEITRLLAKSPELAGLPAGAWSLRAAKWIPTAISAPLSLASKFRFPEPRPRQAESGSNAPLPLGKAFFDFGLVIPEGKLARFVSATDSEVSVAIGMLPTQAAL